MHGKPRISPDNTYIFDNDDLEQLDELSLTSVIRGVSVSLDEPEPAAEIAFSEEEASSSSAIVESEEGEASIDEVSGTLDTEFDGHGNEASAESDLEDTATLPATEVLISPEEVFSQEETDGESQTQLDTGPDHGPVRALRRNR